MVATELDPIISTTQFKIDRFYSLVIPYELRPKFKELMRNLQPDLYKQCIENRIRFFNNPTEENSKKWLEASKSLIIKSFCKHKHIAF